MLATMAVVSGAWFSFHVQAGGDDHQVATERVDPPPTKHEDVPAIKPDPTPAPTTAVPAAPATAPSPSPTGSAPTGSAPTSRPLAPVAKKTMSYGVLTVSTTPSCSVRIDRGSPQQTPLRVSLAPGPHVVALDASDLGYNEVVAVDIHAGQTTQVVRKIAKPAIVAAPAPPPSAAGADKDATINPFAHKP
jgi:hypothetical protein